MQGPLEQKEPTVPEMAEQTRSSRRRRIYRWKLIAGLVLPNFLATADVTIVAPALELISRHFDRLDGGFSWLVTAYTLTNTTFVLLSGQIADQYGRHAALQFHVFWLLIGSILCATAQSWAMLLLGRALQGVGASGIQNLTDIVLSDDVELEENATNNTIFTFVGGVGYAVGPVIGGHLAQVGWRYMFVVSIGVAALSHVLIFALLRKEVRGGATDSTWRAQVRSLCRFDALGLLLFLFGTGLLVLGISWGGSQYRWQSVATIAPLAVGAALFIAFFGYEHLLERWKLLSRYVPEQTPLMPFSLFVQKDTSLLAGINFAAGASMFSAFYFISLYWTMVEAYSAEESGLQLLYYIPGLGGGVLIAVSLCTDWPAQTFEPLVLGSLIEAIAIGVLAAAVRHRNASLVRGMLAAAGVGTGLRFMPVILHASGMWPQQQRARILSFMSFWVPFGGTIAIAMMGAIYTNKFRESLDGTLNSANVQASGVNNTIDSLNLASLPASTREEIKENAAQAIMLAFLSILPFMVVSLIASLLLGNVKTKAPETPGHGSQRYFNGIYLLAWMTDKTQSEDRLEMTGLAR